MIKGFKITIKDRPELSGLWRVEVTMRTGIIMVSKPGEYFRQISPGYNGKKFNFYFRTLDDDEQIVIQKLLKEMSLLQEDENDIIGR